MSFLRRFNVLAYLLSLLAIAGFTFAEDNFGFLLFACTALAVSWWLVETPRAKPVPRWFINAGVLLAALYLFYEVVIRQEQNLILALGHLIIGLLLCKLFETKSNRDYGQILILSLLIIMSASILGTSLLFGLILVIYLCTGLYASLIFHLRCETARFAKRHPEATFENLPLNKVRVLRRDLRRTTLFSGVALLFISVGAFLTIPRTHAGILGSWRESHGNNVTGFSDHVSFGDIGRLQQSDALAMEVRLERNGVNIGSPGYQPYFRGITLDVYDPRSRVWVKTSSFNGASISTDDNRDVSVLDPHRYARARTFISQHYTLHIFNSNALFTLEPPALIRTRHFRTVTVSHRDDTLMFQDRQTSPMEYDVESPESYTPAREDQLKTDPAGEAMLERFLQMARGGNSRFNGEPFPPMGTLPPELPIPDSIREIAQRVAGDLLAKREKDPAVDQLIAERFEQFLRSAYPYSLSAKPVDESLDPTADFLLNRKKTGGHCEYFASAMILMCRSIGIANDHSRMVTGYHGGEFNTVGGYYTVRQKYAHAWVEIYIHGRGWVPFDPSPPNTALDTDNLPGWMAWARQVFDNFQKNWLNAIINFDNHSRQSIFGKIGAFFSIMRFEASAYLDRIRTFLIAESSRSRVAILITILVVSLAIISYVLMRWWKFRTGFISRLIRNLDRRSRRPLRQELAFFDELAMLLKKAGAARQPHHTPREFTELAAATLPAAMSSVRRLTELFYDIRYGSPVLTPDVRAEITTHLNAVKSALRLPPRARYS